LPTELAAIDAAQAVRGPDGSGLWLDPAGDLGLAHRRLAIRDLDARAAQPMHSADGRYVLSFNGEIYNDGDLRQGFGAQAPAWRTSSDTEVILEGFARFGAEFLGRLRGMYALALWDRRERRLWLARDPYGIKPLYYAANDGVLRLSSQVRALLAGGGVAREQDPGGLAGFLLMGSVPEPFTLYRDIRALPPGSVFVADERGLREYGQRRGVLERVAEAEVQAAERGTAARQTGSEWDQAVREAVLDSVRCHGLSSDVPLGLFLSAGVDSSVLAALLREVHQGPLTAVTLTFEQFQGGPQDELPLARQVAAELGLDHRVVRLSSADYAAGIEGWLDAMDQPSIDGLNTYLVSAAARSAGLRVVLSGLGGDELFGGYPSFQQVPRLAAWTRWPGRVPGLGRGMRELLQRVLPSGVSPKWAATLEVGGDALKAYALRRGLFLPFELPRLLGRDLAEIGLAQYRALRAQQDPAVRALGSNWARLCALESTRYMQNQLLRDSDWASMAHGLELRVPLVDVELLRALGPALAAGGAAPGKGALFRAARPALPAAILNRKKSGFSVPLADWLDQCPPRAPLVQRAAPWARRMAIELCSRSPWSAEEAGRAQPSLQP
jgi:asparagine synthase (glutamine-hydrolysing)